MGKTLDLGRRLELHALDTHCDNISLALYCRDIDGVPHVNVHTYSSAADAPQRVAFISEALVIMAGLVPSTQDPGWLRFPCGTMHERALKRVFLDLCKLETGSALSPKPLTAIDKKAEGELTVNARREGLYEVTAAEGLAKGPRRADALTRGFAKLCEMEPVEGNSRQVLFPCRTNHDGLMGLLMFRAQNVRQAMQEEELNASRGPLTSPGTQE